MKIMTIKKLAVFLTALFATTIGQAENATYDPTTGAVTLPSVEVNGKVEFVNVKLGLNSDGTLSVLSTETPKVSPTSITYDPTTGAVTIPSVEVNGKVEFVNVKLGLNSDGTLSVLSTENPVPSTETPKGSNNLSCSTYAAGTNYCTDGSYPTCQPKLSQIYQLQKGMTYDEVVEILGCHGVLATLGGSGSTSVAGYTWGTSSWSVANAFFTNGLLTSFGGPGGS
jgi:hypothetical protein